jgi:tRNA pseudouridine13 synthase
MNQTMVVDPIADLPMVTADLPGIGGRIRVLPEDFEVEEIPAYEPSGQGDHLYLWIEKRDMGAEYFGRTLARRLGVSPGEVGTAGLKDRHAVTRQMVSVPQKAEPQLDKLDGDGIRLLRVSRHNNKLRPGHLHGNRFNVLVRETCLSANERIGPLIDRLKRQGLPNYYGPQRFGRDGETAQVGMALLQKRAESRRAGVRQPPETGPNDSHQPPLSEKRINPFLRKLALSAAQSKLFNLYLSRRMHDGLLRRVLEGDVMSKLPFGGLFLVTDLSREQQRFDQRETVHTGPIFGRKTFAASALAAAREAEVLGEAGLNDRSFESFGKLLQGTRRPNVIYVDDLLARGENGGIRLHFSLPAGSYATVLLKEVMKTEKLDSME